VSSRKEDFLWIDSTKEARKSVILRGVGGDSARVGGRGPMVVAGSDKEGNEILIFDPSAVYLMETVTKRTLEYLGSKDLKTSVSTCNNGTVVMGEIFYVIMTAKEPYL
jgi:hypothetical protein